jgi:Protein of unknown function (DUF938)
MKPCSPSAERNREPILKVLQQWFAAPGLVLEIGAGTGQHAVYFAQRLPHLSWLPTDRLEHLADIAAWFDEAGLPNLQRPLVLDVNAAVWPIDEALYAYSANTAHIMSWLEVERMFAGVGSVLQPQGVFCLYGPFNRDGRYTSDSNEAFDHMLRSRDARMGLRNDREIFDLAQRCQLELICDHAMPANNRTLVFTKA